VYSGGGSDDEAMFAKKPLGGWSCASCEKNLINLHGHIADYQPWSKLPFKEPHERLAKVTILYSNMTLKYGAGFSKMLSMMKPTEQSQI